MNRCHFQHTDTICHGELCQFLLLKGVGQYIGRFKLRAMCETHRIRQNLVDKVWRGFTVTIMTKEEYDVALTMSE